MTKTCPQCGDPFRPRDNERPAAYRNRRFCSPRCAADYGRPLSHPHTTPAPRPRPTQPFTEPAVTDPWWRQKGLCATHHNPDLWSPTSRGDRRVAQEDQAKAICRVCPVRSHCLAWALAADERHGVWGGYTETERAAMVAEVDVA